MEYASRLHLAMMPGRRFNSNGTLFATRPSRIGSALPSNSLQAKGACPAMDSANENETVKTSPRKDRLASGLEPRRCQSKDGRLVVCSTVL